MKKTISLLLALVMCLSLCACGGGNSDTPDTSNTAETTAPEVKTMTKEEMLEQAVTVDKTTIQNDTIENIVKAKSMYCNAVLLLEGNVSEIKQDHIVFGNSDFSIDVYLPEEDLINLRSGQKIVVVGQTTDTIEETTATFEGFSYSTYHYSMPNAYLVQDKFEVTGQKWDKSYDGKGYNFKIGDNPYLWIVYFDESVDIENVPAGELTVFGVVCNTHIYDAVIVE